MLLRQLFKRVPSFNPLEQILGFLTAFDHNLTRPHLIGGNKIRPVFLVVFAHGILIDGGSRRGHTVDHLLD